MKLAVAELGSGMCLLATPSFPSAAFLAYYVVAATPIALAMASN